MEEFEGRTKWCGLVRMGPFSTRIMYLEYIEDF